MSDLLETVLEAHGGLPRWTKLETVSARLVQGGALWGLKGQEGVLEDVFVTARLDEERVSHHPFGAPDRRSAFTPERIAIETGDGTVVEDTRGAAGLVRGSPALSGPALCNDPGRTEAQFGLTFGVNVSS